MGDKLPQKVIRNWHWIVFSICTLICLGYLIFNSGIWLLTDSGFYYQTISQTLQIFISKLGQFSTTDGFNFGFDNSARSFANVFPSFYQLVLTVLFGVKYGQVMFYFLFYLISFVYSQKLTKYLYPEVNEYSLRLTGLFYTFNPFSLLIITLFSTGYVYALSPLFFYYLFRFVDFRNFRDLALALVSGVFLLTYPRLIPIVAITFILIVLIFYKKTQLLKKISNYISFTFFLVLVSFPFIVSILTVFIDDTNLVTNYQEGYSKYEKINYNFKSSLLNAFSFTGGFTPSALSHIYNPEGRRGLDDNFSNTSAIPWYKISHLLFNVGIVAFSLFVAGRKRLVSFLVLGIILTFAVNSLGAFVSLDNFVFLHRTILLFLYNDYGLFQFVQVTLVSLLIGVVGTEIGSHKRFTVSFAAFILIFLLINVTPFLTNFYGFKKVDQIPDDYRSLIYSYEGTQIPETTIYLPYHWLKFSWAPYRLDINYFSFSKYQSLLVPNLRVVTQEVATLYNRIYDNLANPSLQNIAIFNVKNLILFHDVENANQFIDSYGVYNAQDKAIKYDMQLSENPRVFLSSSTPNISFYKLRNAEEYDFFLYQPRELVYLPKNNFFKDQIDLSKRPVVVDQFSAPIFYTVSDASISSSDEVKIEVKFSKKDPNLVLAKISGQKNTDLLLQFNQMYSKSWNLYFVDKSYWDRSPCIVNSAYYPSTNNSRCITDSFPINLDGFLLADSNRLGKHLHDRGNYIGNLFLLPSSEISKFRDGNGEIYIALYFEKQLYYIVSLLMSLVFAVCIAIMSLRK
jgi:hypothetical protein